MTNDAAELCPPEDMVALIDALSGPDGGHSTLDEVIGRYPEDPRLHFLKGSVLAGERRYDEAKASIGQALTLQPAYAIARFQLGFLHYTSGDAALAAQTWEAFGDLSEADPLRLFSDGLNRLAADDQPDAAIALLERGIVANDENPALNADMRMLIGELTRAPEPEEALSETQLLLQQSGGKTRH